MQKGAEISERVIRPELKTEVNPVGRPEHERSAEQSSPYYMSGAQHVIPYVLAPSFYADGKSLDESSKIGVMNQSYSWPR